MELDDVMKTSRTPKPLEATEESPGDGPRSTQRAASGNRSLSMPILEFDESQGVRVQPNGLSLPDGMPYDFWRDLGYQVALVANCSAWWLGDWLVYGEETYDDRYGHVIANTSLGYKTLRNYAWVARRFPVSRRRDTLSFGHHAEVAALSDAEQDAWLTRAERSNWSRSQLRSGLRAARLASRRPPSDEQSANTTALKINVIAERYDRWQSAAEQKNCSVTDWITATLDDIAHEELSVEIAQRGGNLASQDRAKPSNTNYKSGVAPAESTPD